MTEEAAEKLLDLPVPTRRATFFASFFPGATWLIVVDLPLEADLIGIQRHCGPIRPPSESESVS
jgi:hypothetical protein